MQSELKSLSKIFSETIFRIPDYQRGYSWEERHLKDFWSDIEYLPEAKNHYIGVLTLEPVLPNGYQHWEDDRWIIDSKKYSPVYVVDGQQRLTTAIILLQALIESVPAEEKLNYTSIQDIKKKYIFESKDGGISRSYIFGYEKDNPSYEYLITGIFLERSTTHVIEEKTIYTENLRKAKAYFIERLKNKDVQSLERIFTKLTQNFLFNIFYIERELDVFVTFETMNNRGKPLSHLELLKNRLIYLSTRFEEEQSEKEKLRKTINESWKSIYHHLGLVENQWITDDTFLESHFACYFGPEIIEQDSASEDQKFRMRKYTREDGYKNYLLDKVFSPTRLLPGVEEKLSIEEVNHYAQDIKSAVRQYWHLCNPNVSSYSNEEKIVLSQINRLTNYFSFLLTFAVYKTEVDSENRLAAIKAIERFTFFSKFHPYYFSSLAADNSAVQLIAGGQNIRDVTSQYLEIADRFAESNDFIDAIRGIGKNNGYYGWAALRYFMYEYEQHLRARSRTGRERLDWTEYLKESYELDHKSIEHIYPQRALHQYWKSGFAKYNTKERNILRNSLGNLLPVASAKNSSLSNKAFDDKKGSKSNQVGYMYGCYSEIEVAQEKQWGATEILARGVHLLNFMSQRWNIPMGNVENKAKLLGLDFVLNREGLGVTALEALVATHGKRTLNE